MRGGAQKLPQSIHGCSQPGQCTPDPAHTQQVPGARPGGCASPRSVGLFNTAGVRRASASCTARLVRAGRLAQTVHHQRDTVWCPARRPPPPTRGLGRTRCTTSPPASSSRPHPTQPSPCFGSCAAAAGEPRPPHVRCTHAHHHGCATCARLRFTFLTCCWPRRRRRLRVQPAIGASGALGWRRGIGRHREGIRRRLGPLAVLPLPSLWARSGRRRCGGGARSGVPSVLAAHGAPSSEGSADHRRTGGRRLE